MNLIPKQFLSGAFWSAIAAFLSGVCAYATRRLMANNLPGEEFAFFYSVMAFLNLLLIPIHLGTADVILYDLPRMLALRQRRRANVTYSYVYKFQQTMALVFMVILLVSTPLFQKFYFDYQVNIYYLWVFFLIIWGLTLEQTVLFALNSQKKFFAINLLRIMKQALLLITVILALKMEQALLWIIVSLMLITISCTIIAGKIVLSNGLNIVNKIPHSIRKTVLHSGIVFMLLACGYALMQDFGTFILSIFSNVHNVVLFNIALPIAMIVNSLGIVIAVFVPMIADLYAKGEKRRLKKFIYLLLLLTLGAMLLALPILILHGELLITILFAKQFSDASSATLWLVEAAILSMPVRTLLIFFNTTGNKMISIKTLFPTFISALICYPLLSYFYGASGAAIATFLTTAVWLGTNLIYYAKFLHTWRGIDE